MVIVKATNLIRRDSGLTENDFEKFIKLFSEWKKAGESGEDDTYEFGKDSFYITPTVNGKQNVLRHVHLIPILDIAQHEKWKKGWEYRRRRTSDRVLVYVEDKDLLGQRKFLLIYILPEPLAHKICNMESKEDAELMGKFAYIAEQFIYFGHVVA